LGSRPRVEVPARDSDTHQFPEVPNRKQPSGFGFLVQHHADHHLLQVGTMIFGVAVLADGLASFALEVDRGGVEECERYVNPIL
jgi:hypothetical protein